MTNLSRACLALIIGVAAGAACKHDQPNYCAGAPGNNCLDIDAAPTIDSAPVGCTGDPSCSGTTPVCDLTSKMCVQCAGTDEQACTGLTPTCGSDDMCQACMMDAQCTTSQLCLPDGSCASAAAVLYASPSGGDAAACSIAAPCSLTHALSLVTSSVNTIKLAAGTYAVASTISLTTTVTLAGTGAVLDSSAGSQGAVISVTSTGNAQLDYLAVTGAHGTLSDGISCSGGALRLSQVDVHDNAQVGVDTNSCVLAISRSVVASNPGGGISVSGTGATFDITNNFIYRNGDQDTGTYGGLDLGIATAGSNRLEFNTIVDNRAAINSGGVICNVAAFTAPNNIIARNTLAGSAAAMNAQTSGACTYPTSAVQNDTTGLAFLHGDATPFDYHLTAGSTAIDQGTTSSTITIDFDGDTRPQGAADDQGADEYKP